MLAANVLLKISWLYVSGLVAVALGAFVARALVVFGMLPVLETGRLVQPVDRRYKAILVWGGLRGAVTIVLAMVAAGDGACRTTSASSSRFLATLFVLVTLFVNATTLGLVMHVLGLDKLSRLELALRDRVLALSRVNVAHHLQQIMREHNARVEGIDVDPRLGRRRGNRGGAGRAGARPGRTAEGRAGDAVHAGAGALSRAVRAADPVAPHGGDAGGARRPADRRRARPRRRGLRADDPRLRAARPHLPAGAVAAAPPRLRPALLTERLADRFEILMVQQDVLAELALFNVHSIGDLLGADAEQRLGEVIGDRQELVATRCKRSACSIRATPNRSATASSSAPRSGFEAAEYARRLRESIIGREVYADLRRAAQRAARVPIADRPPLDLGLELAGMIARVPLFAGLDQAGADGARPSGCGALVALPDEKIIATGSPPDAMYFIAAGEVTVVREAGARHAAARATSSARWACSTTSRATPT